MRSYPSTTRNILSLSLRRRSRYVSASRISTRPTFRIRSVFRSRLRSRYSSLLRFRRHRARICAGICHYRAPSTSRPHQYRLPLHNGLHVHLHSFDSTRISLVGLDICSVVTRRPLDLERYYQQFLQSERSSLGTNSYLLIRYMSSKLQANGKKTSPVITLQMLGFFRIF